MYKMFERVTVQEHLPNFYCGVEPMKFENVLLRNVFRLEFIKIWKKRSTFERFMKSETEDALLLIVEYYDITEERKSYAVIADISPVASTTKLNLPTWNPADYPSQD